MKRRQRPIDSCEMPRLPAGAVKYSETAQFSEATVPKALLAEHSTKAGVWGRIVVSTGELLYETAGPPKEAWVLEPGVVGIIEPQALHRVEPLGHVEFRVEFLRLPS